MIREQRSVVIHRPVEEVFAYVIDPRNNAEWNGWIIASEVTTEGPIRVGTEARSIGKFLGKTIEANAVITELVPNQRGSLRTTSGPITLSGSRIVEPVEGGGTRFTQTLDVDFGNVFGHIAEPIVVRAALRQVEADLQTLKDLLESRTEATTPTSH